MKLINTLVVLTTLTLTACGSEQTTLSNINESSEFITFPTANEVRLNGAQDSCVAVIEAYDRGIDNESDAEDLLVELYAVQDIKENPEGYLTRYVDEGLGHLLNRMCDISRTVDVTDFEEHIRKNGKMLSSVWDNVDIIFQDNAEEIRDIRMEVINEKIAAHNEHQQHWFDESEYESLLEDQRFEGLKHDPKYMAAAIAALNGKTDTDVVIETPFFGGPKISFTVAGERHSITFKNNEGTNYPVETTYDLSRALSFVGDEHSTVKLITGEDNPNSKTAKAKMAWMGLLSKIDNYYSMFEDGKALYGSAIEKVEYEYETSVKFRKYRTAGN